MPVLPRRSNFFWHSNAGGKFVVAGGIFIGSIFYVLLPNRSCGQEQICDSSGLSVIS
jgi:hypothetical protein